MKKLSKEEIENLGIYEFQGYIGAMTSPTFGGWKGTYELIDLLSIEEMEKPKILEVGCSVGYITRYIAEKFDCEITGIDLSEFLIEKARDEAQKLNLDNITFQCANVEDLPFPDNSFDIVIGEAITALVSNPLGVIKEYRRVLKQGGKIATLDAFRKESDRDEFTDEINEIMTTVLGTEVKVKTLGEWEEIYGKSGFHAIKIRDYYDDIFKRSYSFSEFVQIIFKMLFHMIRSKNIRQKLSPTLRFARKFQRVLKEGDYFGFLIFTGIK